jgi:RNA polymerase sigma-54 factor
MELGLFQEQRMKLVMTNELRQAINILHYSSIELSEYLQEQAIENPLIELEDFQIPYPKKRVNGTTEDGLYEVPDHSDVLLHKYLIDQIQFIKTDDKDIVEYMILLIDNNGYFKEDPTFIASKFNVPLEKVDELLRVIQQLEPVGVGARTLQECLLLQLRELSVRHPLTETIVEHYLAELGARKWKQLAKELGVSLKEIQAVFDFIQTLDPKPCSLFPTDKTEFIVPDLIVQREGEDFKVLVNDRSSPSLTLNDHYQRLLQSSSQKELTDYIQEKFQRYIWLQKSIEQRKLTMVKVMNAILRRQNDFFKCGGRFLKPLTLKEVAEEVDLHESTVSRTTNGKYVQTPAGVFELKYFFTSGIQSEEDESISSDAVRQVLRDIIDKEDKEKPYSDQKIVELMKENHKLDVSRRTIAKYRDQLAIPSSTMRKRF